MDLYPAVKGVLGLAVGFYFRRIEKFRAERVPLEGPVLFVSNHPNAVTDAFVIAASVPRKVHFIATVQLFKTRLSAWLLKGSGVIPISRPSDDPKGGRSAARAFAACDKVLEQGGAVGIFPEGLTHDDPELKTVKSGAARMSLDLEAAHGGGLGLKIVPVGLTYSSKARFHSDVLVHFGEPILVADFLPASPQGRREAFEALSREIERRIQDLMLHLPNLAEARIVASVRALYLETLKLGNLVVTAKMSPRAEDLALDQAIADALRFSIETEPEKTARFVRKLELYEAWLRRLKVDDAAVRAYQAGSWTLGRALGWTGAAILGFPAALFGWPQIVLPRALVNWSVKRFAKTDQYQVYTATTKIVAGTLVFGISYLALVAVVERLFGWRIGFYYALALPVAALAAQSYENGARKSAEKLRNGFLFFRLRLGSARLLRMREQLIHEIEGFREAYRAAKYLA